MDQEEVGKFFKLLEEQRKLKRGSFRAVCLERGLWDGLARICAADSNTDWYSGAPLLTTSQPAHSELSNIK